MNAILRAWASASLAKPRSILALAPILLLLVVPGIAASHASPQATTASEAKGRIDRLSVRGVHGGLLVSGSVLPGSQHRRASVTLFLRRGTQGAFKKAKTLKLATDDRNFALLDPIAPGEWDVKVRFQDPGEVVATTSHAREIVAMAIQTARHLLPGSVSVSSGEVTYNGAINSPLRATTVQLLGLDLGPLASATKGIPHTPARSFKVLATTSVGTGTSKVTFRLHAALKRGERWALFLERSTKLMAGIDFAGLKTVRVS